MREQLSVFAPAGMRNAVLFDAVGQGPAGSFSGVGGGGGGCFISAASHGLLLKHVFFYILLNLVFIGLGIHALKKITCKQ